MKRHIPNTITLCNLICGCIAITFAFHSQLVAALLFIVLGAFFDFFDGFAARKLGVTSPVGKELDSLADVVTFGLAPAAMVFVLLSSYVRLYAISSGITLAGNPIRFLNVAAFLIAAFSALRLAHFNVDERQTSSFIGLPTPAEWLRTIGCGMPYSLAGIIVLCLLIVVSCTLLVCKLPIFALKFKHFEWNGNKVRYIFLISAAVLLAIGAACSITRLIAAIGVVIVWYIILSLFTAKKKENHECS